MFKLSKIKYLITGFLLLSALCIVQSCGDVEPTEPTVASTSINVKIDCYSGAEVGDHRIIYELTPVDITGEQGKDLAFTIDKLHSSNSICNGGTHKFPHFVGSLAKGVWNVKIYAGNWTAECEARLENGNQLVNFTKGKYGCMTGYSFP